MTSFLDKETLTLIQETAKKSIAVVVSEMPNNPQKRLVFADGKVTTIDSPYTPEPRRHTVDSVESFAAAYGQWCCGEVEVGDAQRANIWIDLPNWLLTFFTDEPLRRSWVDLTLRPSPQLKLLQTFAAPRAIDQPTLVRMLRHDLADCVDAGVLAAFRSVDFQKIINARQQVQHEKQSLDSDIVAQVMGERKPDEFTVNAPLFAMREIDAKTVVRITIDIDCDNRKFILQARPGHLEDALDDARAAVLSKLETELGNLQIENVVILAGNPGEREE